MFCLLSQVKISNTFRMLIGFPSIPQFNGVHCIMYVVYCIPVGYRNCIMYVVYCIPVGYRNCIMYVVYCIPVGYRNCIMYVVYCIPVGYRNVRNSLLWIFNFFPVDCLDCFLIINIQLKLKIVNLQCIQSILSLTYILYIYFACPSRCVFVSRIKEQKM